MTQKIWAKFQRAAWVAALGIGATSALWASRAFTRGLVLGMGLMVLNLYLIRKMAAWFLSGETRGAVFATAILTVKFGALLGITWLALRVPGVDALGFGLGVVAIPLAMGFSTIFSGPKLGEA